MPLLALAAWPPPLSHIRLPAVSTAIPFQASVTPFQRSTPGSCQPGSAALTTASRLSRRVLATCTQEACVTRPSAVRTGVQVSPVEGVSGAGAGAGAGVGAGAVPAPGSDTLFKGAEPQRGSAAKPPRQDSIAVMFVTTVIQACAAPGSARSTAATSAAHK
jgi:hypothetical protein